MSTAWRGAPVNREWGRKARKEEDRIRGLNNQAHRAAIEEEVMTMTMTCIVQPGSDKVSLWDCECPECRDLQRQANDGLDDDDDGFACETDPFPRQCHDGNDTIGWCCAPAEPGLDFCYLHAEWGQS